MLKNDDEAARLERTADIRNQRQALIQGDVMEDANGNCEVERRVGVRDMNAVVSRVLDLRISRPRDFDG